VPNIIVIGHLLLKLLQKMWSHVFWDTVYIEVSNIAFLGLP